MIIDFTPVRENDVKLIDLAAGFSVDELRQAANESVDYLLELASDMDDADVVFTPVDEEANDPYAVEGEEHIGWNFAHLIAHVTASTEEWGAYSSILARGVVYPSEPRLRYETPWKDITTKAQVIQRLEESRRMRNGFLDTWPQEPNLEVKRELSPRFVEWIGEMNAKASFLFGLMHELGHYDQIKDAKAQALTAKAKA